MSGNEGNLSKKEIKIILKEASILRNKNRKTLLNSINCNMYIKVPNKKTRKLSPVCYYNTFGKKNKVENDLCNINENGGTDFKILRLNKKKEAYWDEPKEYEDIWNCKLI